MGTAACNRQHSVGVDAFLLEVLKKIIKKGKYTPFLQKKTQHIYSPLLTWKTALNKTPQVTSTPTFTTTWKLNTESS